MAQHRAFLRLEGECNRCGLCCTVSHRGETLYCHNLQITGPLGVPGASFCKAYGIRFSGMRIMFYDKTGVIKAEGNCAHNDPMEGEVIAPWIGKGCSLQIAKR